MTADLVYVVAGGSLLLADRAAGAAGPLGGLRADGAGGRRMLIGLTPLPDGLPLDPQDNRAAIEHVTELAVIVALMGVGLALDRPLSSRDRARGGVGADLAAARSGCRCASRRSPCSGGGRPGPGRRAPARRGAGADRPRPGLGRPGRRAADRRPRGRRGRRGPVHPDLRGRAQRRPGLPVRLRRDPAGDRGRGPALGAGVGRVLPVAKVVIGVLAGMRSGGCSPTSRSVAQPVPAGRRARRVAAGARRAGLGVRRRRGRRRLRLPVGLRLRDDVPLRRAHPRLPRGHARGGRAARAAADPVRAAGARHRADPRAARPAWTGAASPSGSP